MRNDETKQRRPSTVGRLDSVTINSYAHRGEERVCGKNGDKRRIENDHPKQGTSHDKRETTNGFLDKRGKTTDLTPKSKSHKWQRASKMGCNTRHRRGGANKEIERTTTPSQHHAISATVGNHVHRGVHSLFHDHHIHPLLSPSIPRVRYGGVDVESATTHPSCQGKVGHGV